MNKLGYNLTMSQTEWNLVISEICYDVNALDRVRDSYERIRNCFTWQFQESSRQFLRETQEQYFSLPFSTYYNLVFALFLVVEWRAAFSTQSWSFNCGV